MKMLKCHETNGELYSKGFNVIVTVAIQLLGF